MTFRLRTLLFATALVAVALYLLTVARSYAAVPALVAIWLFVAGMLLAGIVYGSGQLRAFCLGGMLPAGGTVLAHDLDAPGLDVGRPWELHNWDGLLAYLERFVFMLRVWSACGWVLVVTTGLSCMIGYQVFIKRAPFDDQLS